jgi:hypothetical protein
LNKLKKLYHKKQGPLLLKCLLVPKYVKKQKDGGKKKHITPCTQIHCLAGACIHPHLQTKPHDSKKQEKRRSYNETRETESKLPQRSNYKETRETETL